MNTKTAMGRGMLAAGVLVALSGRAQATETLEAVGKLAMPGTSQVGTARVMGMDATWVGVAEGSAALQANPAGLGVLAGVETGWHHASRLGGAVAETILAAVPVGKLGGLGVSVDYVDHGSFDSMDSSGKLTGTYRAGSVGGSLGWGCPVVADMSVGVAVRGVQQTLADSAYTSVAGDVGVLWKGMPNLTVGAAVANMGTSGSASALAMVLRAGASYTMDLGTISRLLMAAATEAQAGGVARVDVGVEDTLFSRLAVRAGYRLNLATTKVTGLTGLTAGLGVTFGALALDYAYLPMGELGNSQRVSLTYRKVGAASHEASSEPGGAQ